MLADRRSMLGDRRSERSRSYSPRQVAMVDSLSPPLDYRRRASWNVRDTIMHHLAPLKTEVNEIRQSHQSFALNADGMVKVMGETMIQLKDMQEKSLQILNEKTEVLKQESVLLGQQQQNTNMQLSQLIADRRTFEETGNVMVNNAMKQGDHLQHLDHTNNQIVIELQRVSSVIQNLQGHIDSQMRAQSTTFSSDQPSMSSPQKIPMGKDDRNLRQNIQMSNDVPRQKNPIVENLPCASGFQNCSDQDNHNRHTENQNAKFDPVMVPNMNLSRFFPTYLAPIKSPPVFDGTCYANWKEEIYFWKDIHGHIDEAQLVAELALSSHKIYRPIVMRLMKETKDDVTKRSFAEFISRMDVEFLRDDGDRNMDKLNKFQNFKRRPNESIRGYWIRYDALIDSLDRHGLVLSPAMKFLKALQAMELTDHQKMTVLAGLSNNGQQNDPLALKTLSVRLLSGMGKTEDTYLQSADQNEQVLMLKGGKKGNRPGMEASAIKGTENQLGFNNKFSGNGGKSAVLEKACWRCGSKDHMAQDCHLPFQKVLAFGPSSGKGKSKDKRILMVEEMKSTEEDPNIQTSGEEKTDDNIADEMKEEEALTVFNTEDNDEWIAQWWEGDHVWMVSTNEDINCPIYFTEGNTHDITDNPIRQAIIDTGASASVVGIQWLQWWLGPSHVEWKKYATKSIKKLSFW